MPINVLVTGAGGPAAIGFMQSLSHEDLAFFPADIDPYAAGLYLAPPERRLVTLPGVHPRFVEHLLATCLRHEIGVLVPTVDAELLAVAHARARFEKAGVRVLLASLSTLSTCLDKWLLVQSCTGVVPVPHTAVLDPAFDPTLWSFPLIVKPRTGSGSRGVLRIDRPEDLASLSRRGELMVQHYLPGEEFSVDVFATEQKRVLAAVPRARCKVDSGVAVTARTVRDPLLERYARLVAERIGLTGIANIQFKRDVAGVPYLLEVNARLPGTMALTVASGVHMPQLWLSESMGKAIPSLGIPFQEVAMARTWQEHFFAPAELSSMECAARETRAEAARSAQAELRPAALATGAVAMTPVTDLSMPAAVSN